MDSESRHLNSFIEFMRLVYSNFSVISATKVKGNVTFNSERYWTVINRREQSLTSVTWWQLLLLTKNLVCTKFSLNQTSWATKTLAAFTKWPKKTTWKPWARSASTTWTSTSTRLCAIRTLFRSGAPHSWKSCSHSLKLARVSIIPSELMIIG